MKLRNLLFPLPIVLFLLIASRLEAQVIPDNTLGSESSKVVPIDSDSIKEMIEGGALRGENLFHSFLEFNILEGQGVYFSNPVGIINILSRVTGGNPSQILGTLGVMGEANLYLINPAGIMFGENSSLDIQGNFTATTATQINLGKEGYFSATNPGGSSLLSVSPSALFFNQVAAQGELITEGNLGVKSGQTLALIGGNVKISGGNLTAPSGRIELGAVGEGEVGLGNWIFPENPVRKLIVVNGSLIDITGDAPGKIGVNAATLNLENGAEILGGGGEITVSAGEINLSEASLIDNTVKSGVSGGKIEVSTENLSLTGGSRIQSVTQGAGAGGEIRINATESIKITGFTADGLLSGILTYSEEANSGAGGNIIINSPEVNLADRGFIATVTNSSSAGGTVEINVNNLTLESGGQIITWTTVGGGNAGDITINAADTVRIVGSSRDFVPSLFEGIVTFNLDDLEFKTEANPDVEESGEGGIPYVSVERNSEEIVSGNTVLGAAEGGVFDYYSFTITKGESRGIFDIDYGDGYKDIPGALDTEIFLFDYATGELLAGNDDSDITNGAGGSIVKQDSYIATKLNQAGKYVIVVGEWDSESSTFNPIEGDKIDAGDTYTLQVSLENQGTEGVSNPTDNLNPDHFNPNQKGNSGLFSVSNSPLSGNGGNVNINADKLVMQPGGEVSTTTLDAGKGGDVNLNVNVITLNESLISTITRGSGNSGNIIIETSKLTGENGSELNASTLGEGGNGGIIKITATDTISFDGEDSKGNISGALSEVRGDAVGNAGGIEINTGKLSVTNGAQISTNTFGEGDAGTINITAQDTVVFDGESSEGFVSGAGSQVNPSGVGNAGGVNINTSSLSVTNGAQISTSTFGQGNAGTVKITATDTVVFDGENSEGFSSAASSQVNSSGVGNAGGVNIATGNLSVNNGARISASTNGQGNAGTVKITATDTVVFDGEDSEGEASRAISTVRNTAVGNAGGVEISTPTLTLTNGGAISTSTAGKGNAGIISLETQTTNLNNNSTISSTVNEGAIGEGGDIEIISNSLNLNNSFITSNSESNGAAGNINLQTENLISSQSEITAESKLAGGGNIQITTINAGINNNSLISTSVFDGTGGGGNILINSNNFILLENSDILANAFQGAGGNIVISADAFIIDFFSSGNVEQEKFTGDFSVFRNNNRADISASSALGLSGNVTVPDFSFLQNALVSLEGNFINTEQLIAGSCLSRQKKKQGSFTIRNLDTLPLTPFTSDELFLGKYEVTQVEGIGDKNPPTGEVLTPPNPPDDRGGEEVETWNWKLGDPVVEATEMMVTSDGRVVVGTATQLTAITKAYELICGQE